MGDSMTDAQPPAPSVLPSAKWLMALVDFGERGDRREGRDIVRELRREAARFTSPANTTKGDARSARWAQQLAAWLRDDPRPEAADLARQVEAWAVRLAAKERTKS